MKSIFVIFYFSIHCLYSAESEILATARGDLTRLKQHLIANGLTRDHPRVIKITNAIESLIELQNQFAHQDNKDVDITAENIVIFGRTIKGIPLHIEPKVYDDEESNKRLSEELNDILNRNYHDGSVFLIMKTTKGCIVICSEAGVQKIASSLVMGKYEYSLEFDKIGSLVEKFGHPVIK